MDRTRLRRKLRRINEGPVPPREAIAVACLGAAAVTGVPALAGSRPVLALIAVALAVVWFRCYRSARPAAAVVVSQLCVGAFVGACLAAALLDPPATTRDWLHLPAARGGPAVAAVIALALLEDIVRALRERSGDGG